MSSIAKSPPPASNRRSQRKWLLTAIAILLTALMLFPFYMIINYSLMDQIDILTYPPPLFPPNLTFDGYRGAFDVVGVYLRNSLIYGLGTMLVAMIIATPVVMGCRASARAFR